MSDTWLTADTKATDAEPKAAAEVLEAVAQTLKEAPDGRRYDIELTVSERQGDTDE